MIHTTEHRAKSLESFERKCRKFNDDGSVRYGAPLAEITDLSAVRVIVFVRESVDKVVDQIEQFFEVIEKEDVGDRVYNQGKFGYQSKHLLIKLGEDRKSLVENADFSELTCEIQVRTLLQHAWAEMEHDIQYKSDQDIPLDLKKRFSALAGLLELADREFQNIQKDSESLRIQVKSELINELTEQGLIDNEKVKNPKSDLPHQSIAARDLVAHGKYADAIAIYSEKIAEQPQSQTLYIGRSKARFVNGDVKGAISDLDQIDKLRGEREFTQRLRSIIEGGLTPASAVTLISGESKFSQGLQNAGSALAAGEGVKAFVEFTALDASGYNKAFSLFGKAVCCTLERDVAGAEGYLHSLEVRPATPMAVNICALRGIISIIAGKSYEDDISDMKSRLSELQNYSFSLSILSSMLKGMEKKNISEIEQVRDFLEILPK
ncbi:MAG: hypothetical protein V4475_16260 [Pseudomonadota bacterium]